MKVSVVITTYNSPVWLEKVLWGYSRQTHTDFELLIADDGSKRDTAEVVERLRAQTGMSIRHVWQRDDGFRKCRILNKTILHAQSDYLVFTDGDCIPRPDFLAEHVRCAEPGWFLSGGYYKLPMDLSRKITPDDILSGRAFTLSWLRANGLPLSHRNLKLTAAGSASVILNRITTARRTWNGSNSSGWRQDILAANGFDERMNWGGLDREFGERLMNAGIRGRHVRYNAVCIHLDHSRGYKSAEGVAANLKIRKDNRRSGATRTPHGIEQLQASGYVPGVGDAPPAA